MSPSLEYSGTISVHCNLCLLGSSDSHVSASPVAGTTGVYHQAQLSFLFLVEMGSCCIAQAGLQLLPRIAGLKRSSSLSLPKHWNYKHEPPRLAKQAFFILFLALHPGPVHEHTHLPTHPGMCWTIALCRAWCWEMSIVGDSWVGGERGLSGCLKV